jgi:hypothetical protein
MKSELENEQILTIKGQAAVKNLKNVIIAQKINLVRMFKKYNMDGD